MARHRRPIRPTDPGQKPGSTKTVFLSWTFRLIWLASTAFDYLKEVVE